MEFIKRELTDEDRAWLRSIGAPVFLGGGFGADIVENKEENVAFICLGGQGHMKENGELISEIPKAWLLIYKGHFVKIYTYSAKKIIVPNKTSQMIYSVQEIECEKEIFDEREKIKEIIKEAIAAFGTLYSWVECVGCEFIFFKQPRSVANLHVRW